MRLKSLFTSIPMSQFDEPRQTVLRFVLKQLNSFLAPDTFLGDVENLVELHTKAPDAIPRALKHIFELGGLPEGVSSWGDVNKIDLFGGWLMDGGEAVAGWTMLNRGRGSLIDDVAKRIETLGLHAVVFEMNLRDSRLNLEAAAKIAGAAVDHHVYQRFEKGGLERISIEGFDTPSDDPTFCDIHVGAYWNHFFRRDGRKTDSGIKEMVELARKEFRRRKGDSDDQLNYLLRVLIYNPGLRLLRETRDVGAVIEALDPVMTQINSVVLKEPSITFKDDEYELFRRQVFLNLFSPFPHALAQLEVNPGELAGHPGKELLGEDDTKSAWFLPRRYPIEQLKGPLQVFGCEKDVYAYFKHQELPVNLDWVMEGIIEDYVFLNLLEVEKKCDLLDYNLSRLADNLEMNAGVMKALEGFEFRLDKLDLSPKATVGVMVILLGIGNSNDPDKVSTQWFEKRMVDHTDFRDKIKSDPSLQSLLLNCLKQRPDLLTHRNLAWCGYDARVLGQLETGTERKLREDFFAGDLGL